MSVISLVRLISTLNSYFEGAQLAKQKRSVFEGMFSSQSSATPDTAERLPASANLKIYRKQEKPRQPLPVSS